MADLEAPDEESEFATMDLYEVLGVETDATFEQIKKAYRKRALETHPDRGGNIEEFKRLAKAKDVLSDPQRRKYYDAYGEDGVTFYESWQSADPNEMLAQVGWGGIVCFCVTNLICVSFLLVFPLLVMTREDDWMWGWMFAPLWVIDVLILLMLAIAPLLPYNMHSQRDFLSSCMWTELLQMVCFVTWQALICVNLDYSGMFDWIIVFVPMFALQAIATIKTVLECLPESYDAAARAKVPGSVWGHTMYAVYLGIQQVAWWFTWVLIPLRMDETTTASWWIITVPLYVIVAFGLFAATRDPRKAQTEEESEEFIYESVFSRWKFTAWLFGLATLVMIDLYVSGAVDTGIYFIFLPLFLVLTAFVVAICYTTGALICKDSVFGEPQAGSYGDQEYCDVGEGCKQDDPLIPGHDDTTAPGAEYGSGVRVEREDPNVYA